jgi:MFS family permease
MGQPVGGVLMGRLADRFGVVVPLLIGAASLGVGYLTAAAAAPAANHAAKASLIDGPCGARAGAAGSCAAGACLAGAGWGS